MYSHILKFVTIKRNYGTTFLILDVFYNEIFYYYTKNKRTNYFVEDSYNKNIGVTNTNRKWFIMFRLFWFLMFFCFFWCAFNFCFFSSDILWYLFFAYSLFLILSSSDNFLYLSLALSFTYSLFLMLSPSDKFLYLSLLRFLSFNCYFYNNPLLYLIFFLCFFDDKFH